jgi:hypothetical protein
VNPPPVFFIRSPKNSPRGRQDRQEKNKLQTSKNVILGAAKGLEMHKQMPREAKHVIFFGGFQYYLTLASFAAPAYSHRGRFCGEKYFRTIHFEPQNTPD